MVPFLMIFLGDFLMTIYNKTNFIDTDPILANVSPAVRRA